MTMVLFYVFFTLLGHVFEIEIKRIVITVILDMFIGQQCYFVAAVVGDAAVFFPAFAVRFKNKIEVAIFSGQTCLVLLFQFIPVSVSVLVDAFCQIILKTTKTSFGHKLQFGAAVDRNATEIYCKSSSDNVVLCLLLHVQFARDKFVHKNR